MPNDYEIPVHGTREDTLLAWLLEAKSEGDAWLSAQRPATKWSEVVELMAGADGTPVLANQSNTTYPKARRIARELVAALGNFRHEGEITPLWNNTLYDQAHILSQLDQHWYKTTFANLAHRECLQYGVVQGTGYWYEDWDKHYWGQNRGDVRLRSVAPGDVTFVQLPADHDIQRAYMVLIRFEVPLNLARRIFGSMNPAFAEGLVPDRQSPGWVQKGLRKVQQFLSPALRVAGRTGQNNPGSFPTVDIYHAYTMDGSLNEGIESMKMGMHGTNWSYTVPYVGSPKPTGLNDPATGAELTVDATPEDCLLFPHRRYTIFSNTGVAYDGSSPWLHGQVPLARVWFNDVPWEALGGSLISDIQSMESGVSALMQGVEDSAAARLDPPALYDDNIVSKSWAQAFNPRKAGVRAAAPLSQGNPITYPIDPHHYDVPTWISAFMAEQENRMDYLTGVLDLAAVAKAKQIPGAGTIEKLLEMAGPLVQDMVRAVEKPLTELGQWRIAYYLQFYNQPRIIQTVGPDDGVEYFSTRKHISDDLREELKEGGDSFQFGPERLMPQQDTADLRRKKILEMIQEFRYEVTESGVNEIHRMTTKLFYLQLMKEGFPISWWTFAKIAKIPNFGPPPEGTNTELERWVAQQRMSAEFKIEIAKLVQEAQGGAEGGGEAPSGNPEGRPQSYETAPRIVSKDGGTRSTVTTAGP